MSLGLDAQGQAAGVKRHGVLPARPGIYRRAAASRAGDEPCGRQVRGERLCEPVLQTEFMFSKERIFEVTFCPLGGHHAPGDKPRAGLAEFIFLCASPTGGVLAGAGPAAGGRARAAAAGAVEAAGGGAGPGAGVVVGASDGLGPKRCDSMTCSYHSCLAQSSNGPKPSRAPSLNSHPVTA